MGVSYDELMGIAFEGNLKLVEANVKLLPEAGLTPEQTAKLNEYLVDGKCIFIFSLNSLFFSIAAKATPPEVIYVEGLERFKDVLPELEGGKSYGRNPTGKLSKLEFNHRPSVVSKTHPDWDLLQNFLYREFMDGAGEDEVTLLEE